MTEPEYTLVVAPSAERGLRRIPEKISVAVVEFMLGVLCESPQRVGHPLERELTGSWAARRGAYRIVYRIDDDRRIVEVIRIEHRADVYRPR